MLLVRVRVPCRVVHFWENEGVDSEALAVGKIQTMVARCPHLKPFIASNDKTPFTDGHIDVYSGLGQKKTTWRGRVTVQVKGRSRSGKRSTELSFGISRVDLLGFQRDCGVLYFYVAVDKQGRCTPYYALLSPFTIEHYLNGVPSEQATISVGFKRFPNRPDEIERVVALALKTREQRPSLGYDPELFQRMKSLTVHSAIDLNLSAPLRLAPGALDYAIELTTEGGLTLPVGGELHIYPGDYLEQIRDVAIGAGGVTYEHVSTRRIDAVTVAVRLGAAVTLTMQATDSQQIWNVAYSAPGSFVERLKATRFLIGLMEKQAVEVNGEPSPVGGPVDDVSTHLDELRGQLEQLKELEELFSHLGVDGALIDLDDIEANSFRWLKALHRAFVGGEELRNESGDTSRGLVDLGRWTIMLMTVPGSEAGTWRYVDPFGPTAPHMFRWSAEDDDGSNAIPVTAYDLLEQEHLPAILNLRLDRILDAYEPIADSDLTMSLANQRVLAMILAADSVEQRKSEFLRAASALNEWIIEHEGETPVHLINRWQILYRTTGLSSQQQDAVRALKRREGRGGASMADEIELSCALLLGDAEDVAHLVREISEQKLVRIRSWPIWSLHRPQTVEVSKDVSIVGDGPDSRGAMGS